MVVEHGAGGVHLHRQVLARIEVLDQQREPTAGRGGRPPEQPLRLGGDELGEVRPACGPTATRLTGSGTLVTL